MRALTLFAPPLLAAAVVTAAAEDQPPPQPVAPAPAAEPVPAQDTSARVATPANAPVAPATPTPRWWTLSATLGLGYDSNILLQPAETPTVTNDSGLALTVGARAVATLVSHQDFKMTLGVDGDVDRYPDEPDANLVRVGASQATQFELLGALGGFVTGYNRFWLDGDYAATALSESLYGARTWGRNISILSGGGQFLFYAGDRAASGTEGELAYRHWYLLEERNVRRRLEFGLRYARFLAGAPDQTYDAVGASLGVAWRARGGARPVAGTIDLSGRIGFEFRSYDAARPPAATEKQAITTCSLTGDYWLDSRLSLGLYAGYSVRDSNLDRNDYDRIQVGGRAGLTW